MLTMLQDPVAEAVATKVYPPQSSSSHDIATEPKSYSRAAQSGVLRRDQAISTLANSAGH